MPLSCQYAVANATDDSEFTTWFRGRVLDVTGVDLGAPSDDPPPAVLVDYHA